jgi:hypothetical protein
MNIAARYALRDVLANERRAGQLAGDWPPAFLAQMIADGWVTVDRGVIEPTAAAEAEMAQRGYARTRTRR